MRIRSLHHAILFFSIVLPVLVGSTKLAARQLAADPKRPATVEDVLKIEGIGAAQFSSDGKWLVYNLVPPYDQLSDYSYWLRAYGLSGHQLWIKSLKSKSRPKLQPGLDPEATNFLVDLSPDGKRVVVLEHKLGRLKLVSCRIGQNDCSRFDAMPDIRDMYFAPSLWNERIVWRTDDSFVLPTRNPDLPGSEMRSRGISGQFLWRQWNKAWKGQEATATSVASTNPKPGNWASGDLLEFDLDSKVTRRIAAGRYAGIRLSPDKSHLVAARVGTRQRPSPAAQTMNETHPSFDRRYAIRLIDLETNEALDIEAPFNVDPNSFTWSADSKHFAVFGWNENERPSEGRFYIIEVGTRTIRPLWDQGVTLANNRLVTSFPITVGPAKAVLLDSGLAVYGRLGDEGGLNWLLLTPDGTPVDLTKDLNHVSGRPLSATANSFTVLADAGLYSISSDGNIRSVYSSVQRKLSEQTFHFNSAHAWVGEFRFDGYWINRDLDDETTLVAARDDDGTPEQVVFLSAGSDAIAATTLDIQVPDAAIITASAISRSVLFTVKHGASTSLVLMHGDDGQMDELKTINEHLNAIAHPNAQSISYDVRDPEPPHAQRKLESCLLLPSDYEAGRKYPLLLDLYPTSSPPDCATLEDEPRPGPLANDLWTSRGFIYFRPAIPLDFASTKDGPIAGIGEILDETIQAVVDQGYVDPSNVVLFGFSQGGVTSLFAAAQSDRFSAVISMNGWADFLSHYFGPRGLMRYFHLAENGGDNRWRYECEVMPDISLCPFGFGTTPFSDPEAYTVNSPVVLADHINVPVLLVHSDLDYIDISQYDEMFGALYRAGKEATYVRYWGEGHGPSSPANVRDLWSRIDQFLGHSRAVEQ